MNRILFVCLGNICRSPLAEGIMLHLNHEHNLDMIIDSAGTANYHIGDAPDKRTIANAKKNGIDLSALRGRQFNDNDFELFDFIYVMDKNNLKNILSLAKNNNQRNKVGLFLDVLHPGQNKEVPDPYYEDELVFEEVFQLLFSACNKLKNDCLN